MAKPSLDDLMEELKKGHVYEVSLRDPNWHLDGLQQGSSVFVDPRPSILETLLHELTHRHNPEMTEEAVDKLAKRLMGKMTQQEMICWYKAYNRIKKKGRPVSVED